jgi:hypothetical protein
VHLGARGCLCTCLLILCCKVKPDGSESLRPVDNLSWSAAGGKVDSVNGYTMPLERMSHDTLDELASCMRYFYDSVFVVGLCWVVLWLGRMRCAVLRSVRCQVCLRQM